MSTVAIVRCQNVSEARSAIRKSLDLLGFDKVKALFQPGQTVLVKPNVCAAKRPETGATTNPEVVEAVVEIVKELGGKPVIGDGPAFGTGGDYFGVTGLTEVARRQGVPLVNLNQDDPVETGVPGGMVLAKTRVSKTAMEADLIINLPVLKTSGAVLLSCALKNMKGILSGIEKHKPHISGLDDGIVEVNRIRRPELTIVDGIYGMEGEGPANGTPANTRIIMASFDPVGMDAVACMVTGFNPNEIKYIALAEKYGLGETGVEIAGESLQSVQKRFKRPHTFDNRLFKFLAGTIIFKLLFPVIDQLSRIKIDRRKCIYCGMCQQACPAKIIRIDAKSKSYHIDAKSCIGCMCCHEVCPQGAPYLSNAFIRFGQAKAFGAKIGKGGLTEFGDSQ
jgi:uncharacterized protein (DUF362 family)/Pyruvate/2-oxoacid:ferredoxin oxidoreductase delta subunit